MKTNEAFNIYIERLRGGRIDKINESFSPNFLDLSEDDLKFTEEVTVQGEAYLAEEALILHFEIHAQGLIPCTICNEPVKVEVNVHNFYHTVPIRELKKGVYNFKDVVREAILIDTPPFAECDHGNCRARTEIQKYLAKPKTDGEKNSGDTYHPFANL